jgi:transglutaminase-like putative cysteine protease
VRGINDLPLAPHAAAGHLTTARTNDATSAPARAALPDPDGRLFEWSRPFLAPVVRPDTRELLTSIAASIKAQFAYETREAEGTQTPDETLRRGAGSCRDFALLMMEVVRRLGMAARFVSGYLYDAALDGDTDDAVTGAGATHAWLHVYLPGAGWVPFDPTNALFGGSDRYESPRARPRAGRAGVGPRYQDADWFRGMQTSVTVRRN